ncbi:hypothetical protein RvY_11173 [Ramazzottius varieornatus]|uniref:Uncharacterized protein n=1 Tax=Ramazzottius varieornatus TaxID=947166 RepID=A0A1D1VF91_RAMVA|nr:hypothetical protein RvY_11173 [Ramazzottius varieornatus]
MAGVPAANITSEAFFVYQADGTAVGTAFRDCVDLRGSLTGDVTIVKATRAPGGIAVCPSQYSRGGVATCHCTTGNNCNSANIARNGASPAWSMDTAGSLNTAANPLVPAGGSQADVAVNSVSTPSSNGSNTAKYCSGTVLTIIAVSLALLIFQLS